MRTRTPLREGRRAPRLLGLGEGGPRPGCSVARTALPPAGPASADPKRPHLSAAHAVAPPGPAALEPRRQAHRELPQTAPGAENPEPGERSHRARRAHAQTASLPFSGVQRSNQSASARAGNLGSGSPTLDLGLGFRERSGDCAGGVRVSGSEWRGSGSLVSPRGDLGTASRSARPPILGGRTPDRPVHLLTSGSVFLGRSPHPRNPAW